MPPNAKTGSAIFCSRDLASQKKVRGPSLNPESAACRSKTHRLLVTYLANPSSDHTYSSISTSPSPPLVLSSSSSWGHHRLPRQSLPGHVLNFAVSIRKQSQHHRQRPCFREPPASRGPRPSAPLPRPASLPGGPSPPMPPRRRWPARSPRCVHFFFNSVCGCWDGGNGSCGGSALAEDDADPSGC
jgi:hypothetical protein